MVQFYFLSIAANVIGGVALAAEYLDEKIPALKGVREFFERRVGLRVGVGIAAVVTGVLKLLSVTDGNVPVIGDFIPAVSSLLVGTALLYDRYKEKSSLPEDAVEPMGGALDRLVLKNRVPIGNAAIAIGALHFLIPAVLLL